MITPFEQVVRDHGAAVYRVSAAVVGPDDAEDAWVETFLAALEAYPRLRVDSDVRAWLVTIAHRKAIDIYRARSRRAVPAGGLPELSATEIAGTAVRGPEELYFETDPALGERLRALPEKQRLAVVYRYLADLSYADIATLLGNSEAASRRAAADGVAALRLNLNRTEETR